MKNFLIIFLAVLIANICTLALYERYLLFKAQQTSISAQAMIAAEFKKVQAAETAMQQNESDNTAAKSQQNEALKKSQRLCDYWIAQYDKEPTGLNQALKEKACLKYNKLQAATPSAE